VGRIPGASDLSGVTPPGHIKASNEPRRFNPCRGLERHVGKLAVGTDGTVRAPPLTLISNRARRLHALSADGVRPLDAR